MDRVKRIAHQILDRYGENFTTDFGKNKELIDKFALVRSKQLKNEIVGHITKLMRSEISEEPKEDIEDTPPEVTTV
jgi:small subunit ribosomal protein S17e|tara:strand:+ start:444 stop:671 length:228 start_codon:yes stop_codon:yes gene_type:complete